VRIKPVVFTYVYDPIAAGAGKSATDHLPFVTGVGSFPPVADTIDLIQKLAPGVKAVGTLYNSSEANSRKVISVGREMFRQRGIRLEEVTVTGTNELFQAAQVLTRRNIQAMWITGDNTAIQGFDSIAKVALEARLPLIINDPELTQRGALACVGIGWYEAGRASGKVAARVLRGESPRDVPIEEVAVKKIVLNHDVAKKLGIAFPPDLVKEAGE
jgi:putative ABC transport system substrate-binding protein